MPRAWVMVLGDVGRSPRMQYHASSLCKTVRGRLSHRFRCCRPPSLLAPSSTASPILLAPCALFDTPLLVHTL